jgi:hypothetical protein
MTGSGTVAGAFINVGGTSAIDNTTGVLFSAGDFTAGAKVVAYLRSWGSRLEALS